jgi:predicted small lipoprotein YifL
VNVRVPLLALLLAVCAVTACGKKGPPLAPLRYVPGPATDVKATRTGTEVRLQFVLPKANVQGEGPVALDRVEVFAATVAAGSLDPANRDLLTPKFLIGTLPVRPPAGGEEPAPAPAAPPDPRPAPGELATFVEELNDAKLAPQITNPAPPAPEAATAAAAAAAAVPAITRRIYVARGLTRGGRAGQPSARLTLPLTPLPDPPAGVDVTFSETAVTISWMAPVAELGAAAATFNVYPAGAAQPLNPAPLSATTFERPGVTFGTEECFVVKTAVPTGNATVESAGSAPRCVTPVDTFPPAAPRGLAAVGMAGAVNLIWEANAEKDLGGYLVLRGEAPGDTLRAITATPVTGTTYTDATAVAGVRYVYAVVAVDRATPPNTSAQSNRVEESAR